MEPSNPDIKMRSSATGFVVRKDSTYLKTMGITEFRFWYNTRIPMGILLHRQKM